MKNYIKLLFAIMLGAFACVPEDDAFHATSFDKSTLLLGPTNVPYIKNVSDGVTVPVDFVAKGETKGITSVSLFIQFVPKEADPDPNAEEQFAEITSYPKDVVIENNELLEIAGKSDFDEFNAGDRWIIKYQTNLKSGKVLSPVETTDITFICSSDLAGEYTFSTTDIVSGDGTDVSGCGVAATGSGELTEVSGGVYTFTDNTFGLFDCAYGPVPSQGTLKISDLCGKITWQGEDYYGDSYSMSIVDNTGVSLTFEWHNTYGDGGTTTLTRTDGKTWPLDLYTE